MNRPFPLSRFTGLLLLGLLAACQQDGPSSQNRAGAQADSHGGGDEYPFGLACGWEFASNIDTMNVAFPDESAKYWVALVPMLPGTRLRIDGHYPDARYFSYNVYDPILRPTDAIADAQISPLPGGVNPFASATVTDASGQPVPTAPGDAYTAWVEFSGRPEQPAPNTIYAGAMSLGPASLPQPALTGLIYRVYVPGEGLDFDGGVGLPRLTLESADGDTELLPTADCVEPLLPTLGNTLPELGINDLLEDSDIIDDPFLAAPGAVPVGDPQADTKVFYGLPTTAVNLLRGFFGLPVPDGIEDQFPAGGGFLSNIHNAYSTNLFSRSYGNVVMIRAKAPSYRGRADTAFGDEQLRYWSVCQNDLPSQRYVACVADHQAHLDADGYFTMMVSDPADRPSNAIADNAIDWMPWGPYIDALLIYRHMLPDPGFAEAIQNVPQGSLPADLMGEYVPVSAYCQGHIVEAAGDSAAAVFAACRAYSEGLSRGGL